MKIMSHSLHQFMFIAHLSLLLMPGVTRQSHRPNVCHGSKRLGNAVMDGDIKNL